MASLFAARGFRFQWPADLATSWAFGMAALILNWSVLSSTGSVQQLVSVAALAWLGSLFAPFFGIVGERLGSPMTTLISAGLGHMAMLAIGYLRRQSSWHSPVGDGLRECRSPTPHSKSGGRGGLSVGESFLSVP